MGVNVELPSLYQFIRSIIKVSSKEDEVDFEYRSDQNQNNEELFSQIFIVFPIFC
jgi:hypothetical protein